MRASIGILAALLLSAAVAQAEDQNIRTTLDRYSSFRPSPATLRFYQHDWAMSLAEARSRARKERRPIFFVAITNISGPTNFFTGHC